MRRPWWPRSNSPLKPKPTECGETRRENGDLIITGLFCRVEADGYKVLTVQKAVGEAEKLR